jgi:hypothetical protein
MVQKGTITVEYVPTAGMVADIMTKALPKPAVEIHRKMLGLKV